jgi:hypothetical protein
MAEELSVELLLKQYIEAREQLAEAKLKQTQQEKLLKGFGESLTKLQKEQEKANKRGPGRPPEYAMDRVIVFAEQGMRLLIDANGAPYAEWDHPLDKERKRVVPLFSHVAGKPKIVDYVSNLWHEVHNKPVRMAVIEDACKVLLSRLSLNPGTIRTAVRVAHFGEDSQLVTVLDLGSADESRRYLTLSRGGDWTINGDSHGVYFTHRPGAGVLPEPVECKVDELDPLLGLSKQDMRILLLFSMQTLLPTMEYVSLGAYAPTDAGKTLLVTCIRSITDPRGKWGVQTPLPRYERDFFAAAPTTLILAYDNIRSVPEWFSDLACTVSVGGAEVPVRTYYTTNDMTLIHTLNPFIFAGIKLPISESDIMRRSLILELPVRPPSSNSTPGKMKRLFEEQWPKLLGAVLGLIRGALDHIDDVSTDNWGSMPDFYRWSVAAARGQGWDEKEILELINMYSGKNYRTKERRHATLLRFVQLLLQSRKKYSHRYDGLMGDLLRDLRALYVYTMRPEVPTDEELSTKFPKTPGELSKALSSLTEELAEMHILAFLPGKEEHWRTGNPVHLSMTVFNQLDEAAWDAFPQLREESL